MKKRMLVYPDKAFYHKLDAVLATLGIVQTNDIYGRYDSVVYFSMNTSNEMACDVMKSKHRIINGELLPTNKQVVEDVFSGVFGYSSFVNSGRCVKKSLDHASKNLIEILDEPDFCDGFIYQKVIGENILKEYRCTIIDKKLVMCWERGINRLCEFKDDLNGYYSYCTNMQMAQAFSDGEIADIERLSDVFGIDFGDLDIMRDDDGVIYILDVNPTASFNILYGRPKKESLLIADKFREMLECMYKN